MHFSIATILLALSAVTSASVIAERQNAGRPVASGACCVAETSLKQDTCTSPTGTGRCVPGGGNTNCKHLQSLLFILCVFNFANAVQGNGALNCVAQANLVCDANIIERGKSLCRATTASGAIIDGAKTVTSLSQVKVN